MQAAYAAPHNLGRCCMRDAKRCEKGISERSKEEKKEDGEERTMARLIFIFFLIFLLFW